MSLRLRMIVITALLGLLTASCSTEGSGVGEDAGDPTSTLATSTAPPTTALPTTAPPTTAPPTTAAPATTAPLPPGPAPEIPSADGPYQVGRTTSAIIDSERSRRVSFDIWYPVASGTDGELAEYDFISGISAPARVAREDAPISTDGPFPMVIYSHGSGGLSYIASFFTEALASHGFIVVAPNHPGNTTLELVIGSADSPEKNAINRPQDTDLVISGMLEGIDFLDPSITDSIDPTRIGIAGHSFGGFTALAAGAGFSNRFGDLKADERVKAIALMAPFSEPLTDDMLSAITIPLLAVTGTKDETTPIEPQTSRPLDLAASAYNYQLSLIDAGHQSFTDVCRYQELIPLIENVPEQLIGVIDSYAAEGCTTELMAIDRAHELTNRATIAFLLAHVAGDDSYRLLLQPKMFEADSDVEFVLR